MRDKTNTNKKRTSSDRESLSVPTGSYKSSAQGDADPADFLDYIHTLSKINEINMSSDQLMDDQFDRQTGQGSQVLDKRFREALATHVKEDSHVAPEAHKCPLCDQQYDQSRNFCSHCRHRLPVVVDRDRLIEEPSAGSYTLLSSNPISTVRTMPNRSIN